MTAAEIVLLVMYPLPAVLGVVIGRRTAKPKIAGIDCKHTWDRWVETDKPLRRGDIKVAGQQRECFACGIIQLRTLGES